jgi:integrase
MAALEKTTPGIVVRHGAGCASRTDEGRACSCRPSYLAWVWSPRDGRKLYKTFAGEGAKTAAKKWRRDAVSQVANHKLRAAPPTTVGQEARAWVERAERGEVRARGGRPFKPSVLRTYRRDLEAYVIPQLGPIRVAQLRRRDVQELLVDELVTIGRSGSRIRGVLNALRAVLRRPLQADELQTDPTGRLDLPAGDRARERAASPAEAAGLLAALDESDRALWATAFYAGLRRGELRALRWSDVDDALAEIRVERGWDDEEGEIAPKSEKGTRRVPVAAALRLILLEHKARTGRRGAELVFGRTVSEPFTPSSVRTRALDAWAATAVGAFLHGESGNLEPIGLHECRHTFVSLMAAAGVPLERIGDYVGHSSTYMTDRYRHLIEGQRQDDVERLDRSLTGTRTGTRSG